MTPLALDPLPVRPSPSGAGPRHGHFWHPSPVPSPASASGVEFSAPSLPAWPQRDAGGSNPLPSLPPQPKPANEPPAAVPSAPPTATPTPAPAPAEPADFTDADLRAAILPLISPTAPSSCAPDPERLLVRLEPMLRAAIRRALAESHFATRRPFRAPGLWDRFRWRILALLTSRTYGEILFERTHRFRVEEVFLLDPRTLAMVSYASSDPARHAQPARVHATAKRLARHVKDPRGGIVASFPLPDQCAALAIPGRHALLVAITRGPTNDLLLADLAYCLARVEARFADRLDNSTEPLLTDLQPFLEDCLLIQSPPAG